MLRKKDKNSVLIRYVLLYGIIVIDVRVLVNEFLNLAEFVEFRPILINSISGLR